jgi:hypothetical protein
VNLNRAKSAGSASHPSFPRKRRAVRGTFAGHIGRKIVASISSWPVSTRGPPAYGFDPWASTFWVGRTKDVDTRVKPKQDDLRSFSASLAEFERDQIAECTGEKRACSLARGPKMGRKPKLTTHQRREAMTKALPRSAAPTTLARQRFRGSKAQVRTWTALHPLLSLPQWQPLPVLQQPSAQ